jgi:hypothetical protein
VDNLRYYVTRKLVIVKKLKFSRLRCVGHKAMARKTKCTYNFGDYTSWKATTWKTKEEREENMNIGLDLREI